MKIMGFGGVGWSTPSTMASNGNLYSYDYQQKATFPNSITQNSTSGQIYSKGTLKVDGATTLTGAVTSGALTASSLKSNGALTVNGNTILGDAATDTITLKGVTTANAMIYATQGLNVCTGLFSVSSTSVDIGAPLYVNKASNFLDLITASNGLTVKGTTTLGDVLSDTVTASGTVTANNFTAP